MPDSINRFVLPVDHGSLSLGGQAQVALVRQ